MNKLREIFNPTEEEVAKRIEVLEGMWEEMVKERRCCTCRNTYREEHYEMGKRAGEDTYCVIDGEIKLGDRGCKFYRSREFGVHPDR